jgi:hypothetical protein
MTNRKIEVEDLDAAARGLKMRTASDERLQEIVGHHKGLDIFASKVILEAAYREIKDRCVQRYLAITHDEHKGMGTGQATWRHMWGVAVRQNGDWWIHLQSNSEQHAYERAMELMQGEYHGQHNVRLVVPDGVEH